MSNGSRTTFPDSLMHIVADALPDALVLTDDEFKIIYLNSAAEKLYGYTAQEVLGSDVSLLIPQDQHNREKNAREAFVHEARSSIMHRSIINTGMRSDGSLFTAEITSFIGTVSGRRIFGAIIRDVSDRIAKEKRIIEDRNFFEALFATSPDGILVTDKDGYIIKVNQAFLDMMGYTEGEIIGRHPETLYPGQYDPERIPPHIEQVFLNGTIKNYQTRRRRKDGTIIDVELSISLLCDADGNLKGMVSCVRDITERKLLEERREHLISELQDALAKVKTLSGLLPICASCKRIRTDTGYWQQIESFISEHSEAAFSHGICPECMKKFYPELVRDQT
ncbi:MAG: PAS domain-containing protein [Desulfobacterota bacterium]|nr:PAS domain-containing protein [Thermodesulfobacteriota bacterium]